MSEWRTASAPRWKARDKDCVPYETKTDSFSYLYCILIFTVDLFSFLDHFQVLFTVWFGLDKIMVWVNIEPKGRALVHGL